MNLNFMDAANGIETTIQISHKQACAVCKGKGIDAASKQSTCPDLRRSAAVCRNSPGS